MIYGLSNSSSCDDLDLSILEGYSSIPNCFKWDIHIFFAPVDKILTDKGVAWSLWSGRASCS